MSTIVTRAEKGSALTHTEMDTNFNNLNNDKLEADVNVTLKLKKGADIASAAELSLGSDGNYFDVTGTTTITSIATTGKVGTVIKLHFDAALTLTHSTADLILPGGANITTAAGDEAEFVEYASGDFRCVNYSKANGAGLGRDVATAAEIRTGTDNNKVVTPKGVNDTVLGMGQSWSDLTASRSNNTTYTNSTGKPIQIMVSAGGANTYTKAYVNGVLLARQDNDPSDTSVISFIVPNGSTYAIDATGGAFIDYWAELR